MHFAIHSLTFLSFMFLSFSSTAASNVHVKKMTVENQHDFPFMIEIKGYDCENEMSDEGLNSKCSFKAQPINWGMGFCRDDINTLQSDVGNTTVSLIVEGVQVPENKVFMRAETYERQRNKYCYTWLVILTDWSFTNNVSLKGIAKSSNGNFEQSTIVSVYP